MSLYDVHLETLPRIILLLNRKPNTILYFDPVIPNIEYGFSCCKADYFVETFHDAKDYMPVYMPDLGGRTFLPQTV